MPPRPDDEGARDLEEPLLPPPPTAVPSASRTRTTTTTTTASANHNNSNINNNININNNHTESINKDIVIRLCCGRRRSIQLNHNVFFNLLLCVFYGMSDSLWTGTVFAAYLKRLGHEENSIVGNIEAINGLAVLFSALPVGYLADVYGRDKLIRFGGVLFIFTAILHGWVMTWIGTDESQMSDHDRETSLIVLGVVMGLWGIGGGIVSGPAQALYADSTPAGERSMYYHYLFVTYLVSSCLGPIVSIILFQYIGDEWNLFQLRTIVYVGLGMEVSNAFLMMFFDDRKALDEEEGEETTETTLGQAPLEPPGPVAQTNHSASSCCNGNNHHTKEDAAEKGAVLAALSSTMSTSASTLDSTETNAALTEPLLLTTTTTTTEEPGTTFPVAAAAITTTSTSITTTTTITDDNNKNRRWMIPYIMFFSSLVFSIGSGMTVKFFPLFFKEEVGMSPSQVQIIYVLVPILMSVLSGLGTRLSKTLGRVETTLLLQILGVSCLFSMVFFQQFLDHHVYVLVPVYILRTGLMNSPYPLMESILMDFVPKEQRARWKSLESIAQFGWCGSAAAGGYISDRWDYTHTFFLTALVQSLGILMTALLLPLVPQSEVSLSRNNNHNTNTTTNNNNNNNTNTTTTSTSTTTTTTSSSSTITTIHNDQNGTISSSEVNTTTAALASE